MRGIEFGTTPFAEGLRRSVERSRMFDVPTFRWIEGRQRLKTSYAIFLANIPSDFAGVQDTRVEGSSIVVVERNTERKLTLPASAITLLQ